jgi:probable 2-oxoglutarate dehydrogenase E1 component DHKTD1
MKFLSLSSHNELNIPGLTNPLMYEKITARRSVPQQYEDKLIVSPCHSPLGFSLRSLQQDENVLTPTQITSIRNTYKSHLESRLSAADSYIPEAAMLEGQWMEMVWPASRDAEFKPETGVQRERLLRVGKASVKVPDGFVSNFFLCVRLVWRCGLIAIWCCVGET